jgi:hypothetical protein
MLLFIGFNRLWHFTHIRLDAMLCGFFRLTKLPVATTFWRYVDSSGINQANAFLNILSAVRERVWQLCDIEYYRIRICIDTTVETIFGNQQGGRKGHKTKYRGKKGIAAHFVFHRRDPRVFARQPSQRPNGQRQGNCCQLQAFSCLYEPDLSEQKW